MAKPSRFKRREMRKQVEQARQEGREPPKKLQERIEPSGHARPKRSGIDGGSGAHGGRSGQGRRLGEAAPGERGLPMIAKLAIAVVIILVVMWGLSHLRREEVQETSQVQHSSFPFAHDRPVGR